MLSEWGNKWIEGIQFWNLSYFLDLLQGVGTSLVLVSAKPIYSVWLIVKFSVLNACLQVKIKVHHAYRPLAKTLPWNKKSEISCTACNCENALCSSTWSLEPLLPLKHFCFRREWQKGKESLPSSVKVWCYNSLAWLIREIFVQILKYWLLWTLFLFSGFSLYENIIRGNTWFNQM